MGKLYLSLLNCSVAGQDVDSLSVLRTTLRLLDTSLHFLLYFIFVANVGWLGSRVVSVLDSGDRTARVQIAVALLSGNSLIFLGKLFTSIVNKQQNW